jgi:D-alanyl-D-alanine carboxypeptidase (penicillin-binding protein 5/6)
MNAEAARLQALDTRAMNPSGLDHPKQLSSPYDLALIGREAMKSDAFRAYVATKRHTMPAPGGKSFAIATHNRLVWNYDGAIGIKNGYTVRARATFVGAATRGGRTLIVTMMKTNPRYWPEAAALLDWGFKAADRGVAPVGQLVEPLAAPPGSGEGTGEQAEPQAVKVAPPATARTAEAGAGVPVLPSLLVGAGVAFLGAGVVRSRRLRRRRPRSRLRLDLPL